MRLVNFKEKLKNNSFLKSVFTLSAGTAISQTIGILLQPIISRLYTPEEMGGFAGYFAVISIIGAISLGRYDAAIVLPKKNKDVFAVLHLALLICLVISIIVTLFSLFYPSIFINWSKLSNKNSYWVYFIGIIVLFNGLDIVYTNALVRMQEYGYLSVTRVVRQTLTGLLKIVFGLLTSLGLAALCISTVLGSVIRVCMLLFKNRQSYSQMEGKYSFADIKTLAIQYKKFPLISNWGSLLNTASTNVPILLFTGLYSAEVAGFYSFAFSILGLPLSLVGSSVSDVYTREVAIYHANGKPIEDITFSLYKKMLILSCCIMSFVTFYGKFLFSFVFGSQWSNAGIYAQWMSIWLIFVFVFSPLRAVLTVLNRQEEGLVADILLFFGRVSSILISSRLMLSPLRSIAVFSLSGAFIWLFLGIRVLYLADVDIKKILKTFIFTTTFIFSIQYFVYTIILFFSKLFFR